jgi:hypothetical protein
LTAAIRPIADADVLPYGLPLHGFLGGLLGAGVSAFLVTGAVAGAKALLILPAAVCADASRALVSGYFVHRPSRGDADLARYPWCASGRLTHRRLPRALAEVAAVFLLSLVLFQLAEEFTGFLQHHWQDRYHPINSSPAMSYRLLTR